MPNLDKHAQVEPTLLPGNKVMIYGIVNKKELNENFGILLQYDSDTHRWGGGAYGLWDLDWQDGGY